MQTVLGDLSDAEMMKRILRGIEGTCAGDQAMERAIAQVNRWNATKAEGSWIKAKTLWPNLVDIKPFWDFTSHPGTLYDH